MYYLRQRTRVSGPFSADQIKGLLHRGRIARSDKVSTDRTTWQPISETPELIDRPQPSEPKPAEQPSEAPPRDARVWYHTRGGVQQPAPVDTETLRQLVLSGQVGAAEMVWTEGLPDWQPVSSVSDIAPAPQTPPAYPAAGEFPPPQIQGDFGPGLDLPPVIRKKGWL
jgi:hypothetical protein